MNESQIRPYSMTVGAVRTGAMGTWAPIEIGQWVQGTCPENSF